MLSFGQCAFWVGQFLGRTLPSTAGCLPSLALGVTLLVASSIVPTRNCATRSQRPSAEELLPWRTGSGAVVHFSSGGLEHDMQLSSLPSFIFISLFPKR